MAYDKQARRTCTISILYYPVQGRGKEFIRTDKRKKCGGSWGCEERAAHGCGMAWMTHILIRIKLPNLGVSQCIVVC